MIKLWLIALIPMCFLTSGLVAQADKSNWKLIPAQACGSHDFQSEEYVVGKSRVFSPFGFLPWLKPKITHIQTQLTSLLDGNKFVYSEVINHAEQIIEDEKVFPDSMDERLRFSVQVIGVENCDGKTVDVFYGLFSSQLSTYLATTSESRAVEKIAPQTTAGMDNVLSKRTSKVLASGDSEETFRGRYGLNSIRFTPRFGWDSLNKISVGGRFDFKPKALEGGPFNTISVTAEVSQQRQYVNASLSGTRDTTGWLRYFTWQANYEYLSDPTGIGNIKKSDFSGQFSAITGPMFNDSSTIRFGGLVEGGNKQGSLNPALIPTNTVLKSSYGSIKTFISLDTRFRRNMFSLTYGLEIGSTLHPAKVDWLKHIFNAHHEISIPVGDHRLLDIESQFAAGAIQLFGKIPLTDRFFGGVNERYFIPNNDWKIEQNPIFRALPGNSLFSLNSAADSKVFFSYNFTSFFPVWRMPLVPKDLTDEPVFKAFVDSVITAASNDATYIVVDPKFIEAYNRLENVKLILGELEIAVTQAKASHPNEHQEDFTSCLDHLDAIVSLIDSALSKSADPDNMNSTVKNWTNDQWPQKHLKSCATNITQLLPNEFSFNDWKNKETNEIKQISSLYSQINMAKVSAHSKKDTAFVSNTLNTLSFDANSFSVGPVILFDVAKVGPRKNNVGGMHYGVGAGLRVDFISSLSFSAGYSWNVRRNPNERRGNFLFSMTLRDLFSF